MDLLLYRLAGEQHWRQKVEQRLGRTSHAQRNLFGPTDHEQLQQDFQDMLCDNVQGAQQKWNFDFLQDSPVEGLLQWEELKDNEVPAFYHTCVVREAQRPLQHFNHPLARGVKSDHFAQVALTEKPQTSRKTENNRISEGRRRKQTSLTDYYSAMKRVKLSMEAASTP